MALQGKGMFTWKIRACENGDTNAIANLAHDCGFSHVLVKIADGTYSYNIDENGIDLVPPLVTALRARGIKVWGWHYIYGDYPIGEANKAIQRIQQNDLDGYVIDVEGEYKQPGKKAAAARFMDRLRSALPKLPVALSSYRFPSYHPRVPWKEFLEKCDFNMPQVYWQYSHNPSDQLTRTLHEFQSLTPFRPIIPTGSAYRAGSWLATPEDVKTFMDTAQSLNMQGYNFWEWSNCRKYLPEVWDEISNYPGEPVTPPQDIAFEYIQALNTHNPDRVVELYNSDAIHITSARTTQGVLAIRTWYQSLFSQVLPNAKFKVSGFSPSRSSRHLTWTATSERGDVHNGNDTLGLHNGKISYHYCFFTVG